MLRKKWIAALMTLACGALCAAGPWQPGDGVQAALSPDAWPETLRSLESLNVNKKPYHFYKRDRAYDHEITVLTPFARAAEFVREHRGDSESLTFESVSRSYDPGRLVVRLQTVHRDRQKAEGVLVVLKTDAGDVQPFQDSIESCQLKKIGFYAEMFYVVQRSFSFDLSHLGGTRTLTVVIQEYGGKTVEVPLDLAMLR